MYQGRRAVGSALQGDASSFSGHRGLRFLLCYGLHCGCREGPDPYKSTRGDSRCEGLCDDWASWRLLCFLLPLRRQACPSPAGPVTAEAILHNREEVAVKVSSSSDVKLLDLHEVHSKPIAVQALWLDPVHDFGFFRFGRCGSAASLRAVRPSHLCTPADSILPESDSRSWPRSLCFQKAQKWVWKSEWW